VHLTHDTHIYLNMWIYIYILIYMCICIHTYISVSAICLTQPPLNASKNDVYSVSVTIFARFILVSVTIFGRPLGSHSSPIHIHLLAIS